MTTRLMRRAAAAAGVAIAASTFTAVSPAQAADSWKTISSSESCFTYSFGTMCTTKTTKMRQVPYCTSPPISDPWAQMGWATYCIRYTETNRFV